MKQLSCFVYLKSKYKMPAIRKLNLYMYITFRTLQQLLTWKCEFSVLVECRVEWWSHYGRMDYCHGVPCLQNQCQSDIGPRFKVQGSLVCPQCPGFSKLYTTQSLIQTVSRPSSFLIETKLYSMDRKHCLPHKLKGILQPYPGCLTPFQVVESSCLTPTKSCLATTSMHQNIETTNKKQDLGQLRQGTVHRDIRTIHIRSCGM